MSRGFRKFRAAQIRVPYERQGLIWFTARNFANQPQEIRDKILETCRKVGGENAEALFAYVTSDRTIISIMLQYHIASETTIYRMINKWYYAMDEALGNRH